MSVSLKQIRYFVADDAMAILDRLHIDVRDIAEKAASLDEKRR